MKILVVGIWGFPGSWHRAKYYPPIPPDDKNRWTRLIGWELSSKGVTTHSTTVAITSILLEQGHDVYINVYGLDTLASPPRIRSDKIVDDKLRLELAKKLGERLDEYHDTDPENYNDVLNRARSVLAMFADKYFNEIDGDLKNRIMLKILPGIGSFTLSKSDGARKKYEFHGSPQNTAVALEHDLLKTMYEKSADAVILDISHGINYLPVTAVKAISRASEMYSALRGCSVPVAILNSDPVTRSDQEASIHVINVLRLEEKPSTILKKIVPSLSDEHAYKMIEAHKPPKILNDLRRMISKVKKNYLCYAKVLALGIEYGLILYSAVKGREMCSTESIKLLDQNINDLEKAIVEAVLGREISIDDGLIKIKHSYALQHDVVMDALYLLLVLKSIAEKTREFEVGEPLIDVDSLRRYAEEMGLTGVGKIIFENEISDIKRRVREFLDNLKLVLEHPVAYTIVYDSYNAFKPQSCKNSDEEKIKECEALKKIISQINSGEFIDKDACNIDYRNFFAHAGLERNSIHVAVRDNKVFIGYRPQCLEKVENIIKKVLAPQRSHR